MIAHTQSPETKANGAVAEAYDALTRTFEEFKSTNDDRLEQIERCMGRFAPHPDPDCCPGHQNERFPTVRCGTKSEIHRIVSRSHAGYFFFRRT